MVDQDRHAALVAMWGIQDSLLQSYRGIFLSSQSILFGIAATTAQSRSVVFVPFLGLAIFTIWLWCEITRNRGLDVLYMQTRLLELEEFGSDPQTREYADFKRWQSLPEGDKIARLSGPPLHRAYAVGMTRRRLDRVLPGFFAAAWAFLTLVALGWVR